MNQCAECGEKSPVLYGHYMKPGRKLYLCAGCAKGETRLVQTVCGIGQHGAGCVCLRSPWMKTAVTAGSTRGSRCALG